jgi:hypothetical protein
MEIIAAGAQRPLRGSTKPKQIARIAGVTTPAVMSWSSDAIITKRYDETQP